MDFEYPLLFLQGWVLGVFWLGLLGAVLLPLLGVVRFLKFH
jgi:hypothetical protein